MISSDWRNPLEGVWEQNIGGIASIHSVASTQAKVLSLQKWLCMFASPVPHEIVDEQGVENVVMRRKQIVHRKKTGRGGETEMRLRLQQGRYVAQLTMVWEAERLAERGDSWLSLRLPNQGAVIGEIHGQTLEIRLFDGHRVEDRQIVSLGD